MKKMKKEGMSPKGDICAKRQMECAKHGSFKKGGEAMKASKKFK